ncbi:MAG: hypothetical protein CVU11_11950 [Bacteroidetes bacterium HGW-Bacteroidetes-6]|jgi:hypothetical protein|nr:MAG: hypothetical protein CVU11_11950 [Bacteroidetes bacterium HGW-Bacteroidetes-6]
MKKILSFSILFLWAVIIWAKPVSPEKARLVAQNYLIINGISLQVTTINDYTMPGKSIAGSDAYYIFNIEGGGFIIISADDLTQPVLGYSTESAFGEMPLPPAFEDMLNSFSAEIETLKNSHIQAGESISLLWEQYEAGVVKSSITGTKSTSVAPLLTCLWDQGSLYNALCPQDPAGPGGRVYAGCVATMMGMTIYYYRYPTQPTGTHSYNSAYGPLSVDFSQSHYSFEQMPYKLQSHNYDVAKLLYDCGVAVDMMYSPHGSGAYMDDALNAMKTHFGYNAAATIEYKDNYTEANWIALLKTQLDAGHPLPYAGYDPTAGHAFVCDGYDSNDMFHFNWGWSGSYNGYFYINNLNPGYNFSTGQQAFVNCYPTAVSFPVACGNYTMTSRSGSMVVGHGQSGYLNDQSCSWLITPVDSVNNIEIIFRYLNTESANDVVNIYTGIDATAPLAGTYSGNNIPASVNINGNKAFVTFSSNSSVTDLGFHADYYGNVPQFCTILQTHTDSAGTVTDGSNSYLYSNNATCRWKIMPTGAAGIQFDFTEFSLEDGMDFLYFYDYTTETLVESFTGHNLPQTFFINSPVTMVIFRSDGANADNGFKFNYRSLATGIESYPEATMYLYVNDNNHAVLHFEKFPETSYLISLTDLTGRILYKTNYIIEGTQSELEIPYIPSAEGMYLINLSSSELNKTIRYFTR